MPTTTITIPVSITLPDPATENCTPCCEPVANVVVTCASRTGTGQLCGFSGYSADDAPYDAGAPGAWEGQYLKWGSRELSVTFNWADSVVTYPDICGVGSPISTENRYRNVTGSGTQAQTCTGCIPEGEITISAWTGPEAPIALGCADTVASIFLARTNSPSLVGSAASTLGYAGSTEVVGTYARTLTGEVLTIDGSDVGCSSGYIQSNLTVSYSGTGTLSDPQIPYDVLATAEDLIEGSDCCAETTDMDLTTPESTSPIGFEATSVRLTLTVTGAISTDYRVDLVFTNATIADPLTPLPETGATVFLTTDETGSAVVEVDIPQPAPGYRRCYDHATIEATGGGA